VGECLLEGSVSDVGAFAICVACGSIIENWRERFTPVADGQLVLTERRELAVRVRATAACSACGEDVVEIRVEETH
jgi:hypothetical protein